MYPLSISHNNRKQTHIETYEGKFLKQWTNKSSEISHAKNQMIKNYNSFKLLKNNFGN